MYRRFCFCLVIYRLHLWLVWSAGDEARPATPSRCRSTPAPKYRVREIRRCDRRPAVEAVGAAEVVRTVAVEEEAEAEAVEEEAMTAHRRSLASFLPELSG